MLGMKIFSGNRCAKDYGEEFKYEIRGFHNKEFEHSPLKPSYVQRCAEHMKAHTPLAYAWCKDMALGADISLEQATRFFLHEEEVHAKWKQEGHCTAMMSVGSSSQKGESLSGENWDWQNSYYQLPSVIKVRHAVGPATLTYNYPGLPFCCGVNEAALSLVWTGTGYAPVIKSRIGVPTYAFPSEVLRMTSVHQAEELFDDSSNAGCFVFMIADTKGDCAIIEGIPGHIEISRGDSLYHRSNLFMSERIKRISHQKVSKDDDAVLREIAMGKYAEGSRGYITEGTTKSILRKSPVFQQDDMDTMTIDSIVVNAHQRTLHIARGGNISNPWKTYSL